MVSSSNTRLIMVSLFLLHALIVHARDQAKVANSLETTNIKGMFKQDLVQASNQIAKARMVNIGGRKMTIPDELQEEDHKVVMKNLMTPLISGAANINYKVNDHIPNGHGSTAKLNKEAFSTTDYRGPRSNPSKHH